MGTSPLGHTISGHGVGSSCHSPLMHTTSLQFSVLVIIFCPSSHPPGVLVGRTGGEGLGGRVGGTGLVGRVGGTGLVGTGGEGLVGRVGGTGLVGRVVGTGGEGLVGRTGGLVGIIGGIVGVILGTRLHPPFLQKKSNDCSSYGIFQSTQKWPPPDTQ